MKIFLVGAEFFDAEGRTGMTKLLVVFRNFAKASNKREIKTIEHTLMQCDDTNGIEGLDREYGNCSVEGHEEKWHSFLHVKKKKKKKRIIKQIILKGMET